MMTLYGFYNTTTGAWLDNDFQLNDMIFLPVAARRRCRSLTTEEA